jgi:outer membrane protein OmpA-like peptidoglycan-associated protein
MLDFSFTVLKSRFYGLSISDQPQEFCVRRLSSILVSLAVAATGLTITSTAASAAGGTAKVIRSTISSPASIGNATALRSVRLAKTNQTLFVGRDTSVAGSRLSLWKINDDLSFDEKFGTPNLGANSENPTASNSLCVTNNNRQCFYVNSFAVNENADRYAMTWRRELNGSGSNANTSRGIDTTVIGKLSTGEILGSANTMSNLDSQSQVSDWSQYNIVNLSETGCTTATGSTVNGIALNGHSLESWTTAIRPDGSIVLNLYCSYSNGTSSPYPSAVKDYQTSVSMALKASNGSLMLDSSFGTSGYVALANDITKCVNSSPNNSVNTGITSNTSTAMFVPIFLSEGPRSTQVPSYLSSQGVTSYDGCQISNSTPTFTTRVIALQANGTIKNSTLLSSGTNVYVSRWIIDPQGRWNGTTLSMFGAGPNSTPSTSFMRILADGKPDTTLGADGMKQMTSLPSSVSVGGTTVPLSYNISGYATTATGIKFVGIANVRSTLGGCSPNQVASDFNTKYYPYYISVEDGLDTSYGNSGLGEAFQIENSGAESCGGAFAAKTTYINSKGQPAVIGQVLAVGSQVAGLFSTTWDAAAGVTSGGDGTGVASGPIEGVDKIERVDKKVYSTKLPKSVQTDIALNVLTSKQAKKLGIRVSTPKICVALTTSVIMVNPGRCVVRIIDEDTKKVLRRMKTTVKKAEEQVGTTLATNEPIMFKQARTKLSKQAKAQVTEIAETAKTASRVVVIGHSAALGEVSQYSYAISRNRALAVKAALVKAGVKATIEVVALSYRQPKSTKKTESAQSKNRRAEVFIFP